MSSSHDELFLQVQHSLASVATLADLEDVRVRFLGKKGVLTERLKELGRADPEQRRVLARCHLCQSALSVPRANISRRPSLLRPMVICDVMTPPSDAHQIGRASCRARV